MIPFNFTCFRFAAARPLWRRLLEARRGWESRSRFVKIKWHGPGIVDGTRASWMTVVYGSTIRHVDLTSFFFSFCIFVGMHRLSKLSFPSCFVKVRCSSLMHRREGLCFTYSIPGDRPLSWLASRCRLMVTRKQGPRDSGQFLYCPPCLSLRFGVGATTQANAEMAEHRAVLTLFYAWQSHPVVLLRTVQVIHMPCLLTPGGPGTTSKDCTSSGQ